jgi:excisionase family DNA binding protein
VSPRAQTGGSPTVAEGGNPAVFTVEEAGRLLRVSRGAAYEAVRRGEIPSVRIGRRILVPAAALRALLGEDE